MFKNGVRRNLLSQEGIQVVQIMKALQTRNEDVRMIEGIEREGALGLGKALLSFDVEVRTDFQSMNIDCRREWVAQQVIEALLDGSRDAFEILLRFMITRQPFARSGLR